MASGIERHLHGDPSLPANRRRLSRHWDKETDVNFGLAASYRFAPGWSVGLELAKRARMGRTFNPFRRPPDQHRLLISVPTIHYGGEHYFATLTVLDQLPWGTRPSPIRPEFVSGGRNYADDHSSGYGSGSRSATNSEAGDAGANSFSFPPPLWRSRSSRARHRLSERRAGQELIFPGATFHARSRTLTDAQMSSDRGRERHRRARQQSQGLAGFGRRLVHRRRGGRASTISSPSRSASMRRGRSRTSRSSNTAKSYGGEVRNPKWRAQFTGKTQWHRPCSLTEDIKNISGRDAFLQAHHRRRAPSAGDLCNRACRSLSAPSRCSARSWRCASTGSRRPARTRAIDAAFAAIAHGPEAMSFHEPRQRRVAAQPRGVPRAGPGQRRDLCGDRRMRWRFRR